MATPQQIIVQGYSKNPSKKRLQIAKSPQECGLSACVSWLAKGDSSENWSMEISI